MAQKLGFSAFAGDWLCWPPYCCPLPSSRTVVGAVADMAVVVAADMPAVDLAADMPAAMVMNFTVGVIPAVNITARVIPANITQVELPGTIISRDIPARTPANITANIP